MKDYFLAARRTRFPGKTGNFTSSNREFFSASVFSHQELTSLCFLLAFSHNGIRAVVVYNILRCSWMERILLHIRYESSSSSVFWWYSASPRTLTGHRTGSVRTSGLDDFLVFLQFSALFPGDVPDGFQIRYLRQDNGLTSSFSLRRHKAFSFHMASKRLRASFPSDMRASHICGSFHPPG